VVQMSWNRGSRKSPFGFMSSAAAQAFAGHTRLSLMCIYVYMLYVCVCARAGHTRLDSSIAYLLLAHV
jgi:hypothetical protein